MNAFADRRATAAAVWGGWAALLVGALALVAGWGSNVPSWDDWDMVPTLTGDQPVTAEWLWSQHNEHRVPVPRLLYLALNRLTVVDFRTTMYFDVLAMAGLAAAMLLLAARLRGRAGLADLFFPVVLLHWGHAVNLLWGWQLQFFTSVVLACIALLAVVAANPRAPTVVATCAVLLTMCGANGLGLVPALALWPLMLAVAPSAWIGGEERRPGATAVVLALLALVLTGLYFVGWQPVPYHPKSYSVRHTIETAGQFLSIGMGPAIRSLWPWAGLAVLLFFGATGIRLVLAWRERPPERARVLGLACALAAIASLAVGLGLGRNGFEPRYVVLAAPAWCTAYFVWQLYGPAGVAARVHTGLAVVALGMLGPNIAAGLAYARELRGALAGFERDLAAGVPAHQLIRRHGTWLHPHQDIVADYLVLLRRAGIGQYRSLQPEPPFHTIPVGLSPVASDRLRWSDSTAQVDWGKPYLLFELPELQRIEGIRLRYRYQSDDGTLPYIGIHWRPSAEREFAPERFYKYSPTGDRANWERGAWTRLHDSTTSLTVWIADTVRQIRITPDFRPAVFRIAELSLLRPKE